MIRNDQKVERAAQLDALASRRGDLFTPGEAVGILWPKAIAKHYGVEGLRRVKMRITPIHARRVTAVNIWRIGPFGQNLFGCFLIQSWQFLCACGWSTNENNYEWEPSCCLNLHFDSPI